MLKQRNEFTRRLLEKSNIPEGSRILDVGCGTGAVTVLLSDIVGYKGEVIGIDNDPDVITAAGNNIRRENIRFMCCDMNSLPEDLGVFDIIVGRRVLMYDDTGDIKRLIHFLSDDGKIIFHETDYNLPLVNHRLPLHFKVLCWILETLKLEGVDVNIGSKLYSVFKRSGLLVEDVMSEQTVQYCETGSDLCWLVGSMKDRMVNEGVVDAGYDFEKLGDDLRAELDNSEDIFVREVNYGIIGCKKN